jgi:S-adenosylmethionine/arginine decarboxylase-like enzyme
MTLNHKHILVSGYVANPPLNEAELEDWFRDLVKAVGMQVFMEPKAKWCDGEGNEGITGVVGLETSHSSCHIWTNRKVPFFTFDLYSCADFSPRTVLELLDRWELVDYDFIVLDRNPCELKERMYNGEATQQRRGDTGGH